MRAGRAPKAAASGSRRGLTGFSPPGVAEDPTHHAIYDRWHAVMVKKGLAWTIHDFRRSAARNLVNAGVHPDVAKDITGHRSTTMFSRYAINPAEAVRKAAQQVDAYLADRRASSVESVPDLSSGI